MCHRHIPPPFGKGPFGGLFPWENYKNSQKIFAKTVDKYTHRVYNKDRKSKGGTKMAQKYTIRDREAGNTITTYDTFEEALAALKEFEEEDERNGEYTPDFYEIVTPFDEFMLDAGMSIKELSDRFGVPYRTVQNWANHGTNHRPCPDYIINMMREILG